MFRNIHSQDGRHIPHNSHRQMPESNPGVTGTCCCTLHTHTQTPCAYPSVWLTYRKLRKGNCKLLFSYLANRPFLWIFRPTNRPGLSMYLALRSTLAVYILYTLGYIYCLINVPFFLYTLRLFASYIAHPCTGSSKIWSVALSPDAMYAACTEQKDVHATFQKGDMPNLQRKHVGLYVDPGGTGRWCVKYNDWVRMIVMLTCSLYMTLFTKTIANTHWECYPTDFKSRIGGRTITVCIFFAYQSYTVPKYT